MQAKIIFSRNRIQSFQGENFPRDFAIEHGFLSAHKNSNKISNYPIKIEQNLREVE